MWVIGEVECRTMHFFNLIKFDNTFTNVMIRIKLENDLAYASCFLLFGNKELQQLRDSFRAINKVFCQIVQLLLILNLKDELSIILQYFIASEILTLYNIMQVQHNLGPLHKFTSFYLDHLQNQLIAVYLFLLKQST